MHIKQKLAFSQRYAKHDLYFVTLDEVIDDKQNPIAPINNILYKYKKYCMHQQHIVIWVEYLNVKCGTL